MLSFRRQLCAEEGDGRSFGAARQAQRPVDRGGTAFGVAALLLDDRLTHQRPMIVRRQLLPAGQQRDGAIHVAAAIVQTRQPVVALDAVRRQFQQHLDARQRRVLLVRFLFLLASAPAETPRPAADSPAPAVRESGPAQGGAAVEIQIFDVLEAPVLPREILLRGSDALEGAGEHVEIAFAAHLVHHRRTAIVPGVDRQHRVGIRRQQAHVAGGGLRDRSPAPTPARRTVCVKSSADSGMLTDRASAKTALYRRRPFGVAHHLEAGRAA